MDLDPRFREATPIERTHPPPAGTVEPRTPSRSLAAEGAGGRRSLTPSKTMSLRGRSPLAGDDAFSDARRSQMAEKSRERIRQVRAALFRRNRDHLPPAPPVPASDPPGSDLQIRGDDLLRSFSISDDCEEGSQEEHHRAGPVIGLDLVEDEDFTNLSVEELLALEEQIAQELEEILQADFLAQEEAAAAAALDDQEFLTFIDELDFSDAPASTPNTHSAGSGPGMFTSLLRPCFVCCGSLFAGAGGRLVPEVFQNPAASTTGLLPNGRGLQCSRCHLRVVFQNGASASNLDEVYLHVESLLLDHHRGCPHMAVSFAFCPDTCALRVECRTCRQQDRVL
ncbi:hypothetical protein H696_03567 [Fonticula alba]|uniref:Uncharacterized protein n=1 Tax=Fonticula alba TaxID=691883 RepID=A0A058Z771_FONAL|nr:hypothetical protein H696_03567 [Fonticula alba]KCV70105.1 hypothetical protein H696_03567 [Fonticula alba]|eukprot:XP_009495711.1 hypothetical protein H696_03567 [Fonticula alba]